MQPGSCQPRLLILSMTQSHIQDHHEHKTQGKGDCANIGMLSFRHFGDQFFYNNIDHGAGGKCQKVGHDRCNQSGGQDRDNGGNRFKVVSASKSSCQIWTAIPSAREKAPAAVIPTEPVRRPA